MKTPVHTHRPHLQQCQPLLIIVFFMSVLLSNYHAFGQYSEPVAYDFYIEIKNTQGQVLCKEEINKEIELKNIGTSTLINFNLTYNGGKVYTHWHVKGEKENGLFIIERSSNGKDYEQIGFKKGIGVPIEGIILYCWVDEKPLAGNCRYRLLKVYEDGGYYYSDAVSTTERQGIKPASKGNSPLIVAQEWANTFINLEGELKRFVIIDTDITELKQLKEEIGMDYAAVIEIRELISQ